MHSARKDFAATMSSEIACHGCDLLVNVQGLKHGDRASCPRCGALLTQLRQDAFSRAVAFSMAALILLALANAYPFLSFSASGLESVMTLRETPRALWNNGLPEIAILVSGFIIVIPAAILVMMILLCVPLSHSRYRPWMVTTAKGIFLAQNWAMVEVFIIGVIVSLVKISAMATVVIGISFWAYAAFTICFILSVSSLDRFQCWERIEALQEAAE